MTLYHFKSDVLIWALFDAYKSYEELKKKGVLVRFWGKEKIEDFLRITIGTPEQMEVLFAKAAEILQEQKGD